jgi:hypothetical protein
MTRTHIGNSQYISNGRSVWDALCDTTPDSNSNNISITNNFLRYRIMSIYRNRMTSVTDIHRAVSDCIRILDLRWCREVMVDTLKTAQLRRITPQVYELIVIFLVFVFQFLYLHFWADTFVHVLDNCRIYTQRIISYAFWKWSFVSEANNVSFLFWYRFT